MSTSETPPVEAVSVSFAWPKEQPKAQFANQFAITLGVPTAYGPDAFYLLIGHAEPPFLSAMPDGDIDHLPIDVVGRYVFTRSRLEELRTLLDTAARTYDQATGGEQDGDANGA